MSIDDLKGAYLACEGSAGGGRMHDAEALLCSIIYEELKQRAFGGDFQSLRRWFRSVTSDLSSTAARPEK
jgi:hypothetical protein